MFISDITDAIERNDYDILEQAFRILARWPLAGTIEGASPKARRAALGRVCEALATDDRSMPDETFNAVLAAGGELADRTYAAGAYHVKQHRGHFHELLQQAASAGESMGR